MKITRFMEVMFSNTDEEVAEQVDRDIKNAQKNGVVDTEEVKYEDMGDGRVSITDKENGEITVAEKSADDAEAYDLIAVPDADLERFAHPQSDGRKPGNQVGAPDEKVTSHLGGKISDQNQNESVAEEDGKNGPQDTEVCPGCGKPGADCECGAEEDERNYSEMSVSSDNVAWQKMFSYPCEFCDCLFSDVINNGETSKVGDLIVEKNGEDDNSVIVTSESTGDQIKVTLDGDEMEVAELEHKNFCGGEQQYEPLRIIGVQPYDHVIAETQAYSEEDAAEMKARFEENGVVGVEIFDNLEDAQEYASQLINGLSADPAADQAEEVEQREFSDHVLFTRRYSTDDTVFMTKMFSEQAYGIAGTRDAVAEAITSGEEVQTEDGAIIIPVDEQNAIINDGGVEYTLASIQGNDLVLEPIDPAEMQAVLGDESLIEYESENGEEPDEKEFSEIDEEIYCNEAQDKFFSESEFDTMTEYMERLFSDKADQSDVEKALESGETVETDNEVITPVDDETAVIEDKATGEFTKAEVLDDDHMDVNPISEDAAQDLMDEKKFSEFDEEVYCNEAQDKFFSESEFDTMTEYMERLFSEESDQGVIEAAIEGGEPLETETEIITPISDDTAIIEDKGNGEFTKAVILDEDRLNIHPLSDDEAENLLGETEDAPNGDTENAAALEAGVQKNYSEFDEEIYCNEAQDKFFSESEFDTMTEYMERLFSEEADQEDVEKAIESGEIVETDDEVITPVNDTIAVIKDKNTDEYTKAEVLDEDHMDVNPISDEEASDLMESKAEKKASEEDEDEKKFSDTTLLNKFFGEAGIGNGTAVPVAPQAAGAGLVQALDANGNPVLVQAAPGEVAGEMPVEAAPEQAPVGPEIPSVEAVEDKALAAIQSIKAAGEEAAAQIMNAKAATVEQPVEEPQIREAQFSEKEKTFSEGDTLISWLSNK